MIISIIIVLSIISIVTFSIVQSMYFKKNKKILLAVGFLFFSLSCLGIGMYAPTWFSSLPENIISLNFSTIKQNLGQLWANNIPDIYQKFFTKKKWSGNQNNIIVVFAESLSPIDSLRVGGVNDNLPYFDLIQKQGTTFTNFIANGCTSDTAHIWLLLWVEPLKLMWSQTSAYSWYVSHLETLPAFFATQGYTPIFISAVNLNFLNQKSFLSGIGFSQIIDEEAFTDKKKYVFDAAPDHELYNKTLETIKQQDDPYFMVLQSISFHKPYNTPYGTNQKDALRYADKSLFYFYLQLKKSGFFDNGILVVVSDHRKMEPLETKEKEALGEYRYTKVLATIVWTGIIPGGINTNIIQHTDIFYGLKKFAGKWIVTVSKLFNDIFSSSKKRDRGIVYCRYFQNNNKYTIVSSSGGKIFNKLEEISTSHKFIHQYLSSYISFQQWSWAVLSSWNNLLIIAHQWSPRQAPENSLEWFLLAKENGAHGIELDVAQTKDKQNIVIHGERMRATRCGKNYIVANHTLEELKNKCPLKNGEPLLTLEEMLQSLDGLFAYYFVEIKVYTTKDAEQQTIDAIQTVQKLGMQDRVIFTSYDKQATYIIWSYKNIIAWRDTYNINELSLLPHMSYQYYLMPQDLIKDTTPQEVEDIGKKLIIYTVNTTGDLEKLYRQGVRIIMTDDVPGIKSRADNYLW